MSTLRSYESAISHGFFVVYYGPEFVAEKIQEWIKNRPTDTLASLTERIQSHGCNPT